MQGLIKILYLTSCHIFVLVYKLIEIGSDDFIALPQDVNSVGGEYAGVVEQIHSTIHVEHEECEEVEHQDYENCCAFPIVIVVGVVDCWVLAFGVFGGVDQPSPKTNQEVMMMVVLVALLMALLFVNFMHIYLRVCVFLYELLLGRFFCVLFGYLLENFLVVLYL